jgi:hypothetical protein
MIKIALLIKYLRIKELINMRKGKYSSILFKSKRRKNKSIRIDENTIQEENREPMVRRRDKDTGEWKIISK